MSKLRPSLLMREGKKLIKPSKIETAASKVGNIQAVIEARKMSKLRKQIVKNTKRMTKKAEHVFEKLSMPSPKVIANALTKRIAKDNKIVKDILPDWTRRGGGIYPQVLLNNRTNDQIGRVFKKLGPKKSDKVVEEVFNTVKNGGNKALRRVNDIYLKTKYNK